MLIVDQLNLTGASPLVGRVPFPGVKDRFVDMVNAYDPQLCQLARHIAAQYSIVMHDGVYAGLIGPAVRIAGRSAVVAQIGRRCGRHVHRARNDRRARTRLDGGRLQSHHQRSSHR